MARTAGEDAARRVGLILRGINALGNLACGFMLLLILYLTASRFRLVPSFRFPPCSHISDCCFILLSLVAAIFFSHYSFSLTSFLFLLSNLSNFVLCFRDFLTDALFLSSLFSLYEELTD